MKGKTNNPNGRPKGTPNKTTKEIKQILTAFVSDNIEQLQADYNQLEPETRLRFMKDILKFVVPVQNSNDISLKEQLEKIEVVIIPPPDDNDERRKC